MKKTIKNLTGILLFLSLSIAYSNAQDQIFTKGDIDLNVGLGFGASKKVASFSRLLPTIQVTGDYALRDDWGPGVFGVGAYFGVTSYKWDAYNAVGSNTWGVRYVDIVLASRATYHYTFVDNLDTYGGVVFGFDIGLESNYGGYTGASNTFGVAADVFAGAKYYFSDSFSAYSELSSFSSLPIFTIGAAFKF